MEHNNQHVMLEAYIDGEMTPQEIQAFEAALATDTNLQNELEARRMDRDLFRSMLGEAPQEKVYTRKTKHHKFPISRTIFALAASVCLVILVPSILRNHNGAEGPRSILTISGQVAVLRFGEIPGETTMLETGAIELPAGLSR